MAVYTYNYIPDVFEHYSRFSRKITLERIDRPKVPIMFGNNHILTTRIWCLLDSGADNIVLNSDIAHFLQIDLSKAPIFKTGVVGGETIKVRRHNLNIILEGKTYSSFADFSDTHPFPILGRNFFELTESIVINERAKQIKIVMPSKAN